jgi:protocatechuate 3,4-dioxygenase beta subunit
MTREKAKMNAIELHDDDQPIGRVLSRREVLALIGGAGAVLLGGCTLEQFLSGESIATPSLSATSVATLPACVVRPALTEGPYFVDNQLNRSDIRIDPSDGSVKEGAPLRLAFQLSDVSANACSPLAGAQVDIWHCDALGVYSGVSDPGFDTSGQLWLRGYQVTDESGYCEFTTIYPGWYSGRAVHIHFKIRTDPDSNQGYEFTSQLFFDEAFTNAIYTQSPYAAKGAPNTPNASDGIYRNSGGQLTLNVVEEGDGYAAIFDIGLDLS